MKDKIKRCKNSESYFINDNIEELTVYVDDKCPQFLCIESSGDSCLTEEDARKLRGVCDLFLNKQFPNQKG